VGGVGGMNILRALRAKGHDARVDASDLGVLVIVGPAGDAEKALAWACAHEQQLRCELVAELQMIAGVSAVFPDGRVRKIRGADGAEITGRVRVERRPESGPG